MLTPTLDSVEALYRKLERESYRAYHAKDPVHKADHFFNFCVTAHSMRDHFLERVARITIEDRQPFVDEWSQHGFLVAVSDIANSAKHFTLRNRDRTPRKASTRSVRQKKSLFVDVYKNDEGRLFIRGRSGPDLVVTLSDGVRLELYRFMATVSDYWRNFLHHHGIRIRRQPHARLSSS